MSSIPLSTFLAERARACYYGLLIGDALAAPAHWYYNPRDITREFGRITDYIAPPKLHPSSILNLSSTGTGGRGSQEGNIVGDVILHGKKHLWLTPRAHYHGTLAKGENTLNAQMARLVVRTVSRDAAYDSDVFLREYVTFMTTPGSHNDTYAETYHRMFFKNYARGVPPAACAEDDGHNVASMGGFVMLPPVAMLATAGAVGTAHAGASAPVAEPSPSVLLAAREMTVKHMYTTHKSASLERRAAVYAELLARVAMGGDLRTCVKDAGKRIGVDIPKVVAGAGEDTSIIGGTFSSACYIEHSFPALLYLAYKYADDPEAALVACVNVGGENAHRAAALGALMGAAHGMKAWPKRWVDGLFSREEIAKEAAAFSALVAAKAGAPAV